jgi:hypothetical protein
MKVEHVVIKEEPSSSSYDLSSRPSTVPCAITASAVQETPNDSENDAQMANTTDQSVVIKVEQDIAINESPSADLQEPSEKQVPDDAGDMFAEFCTSDLFDGPVATKPSESP